MIAYLLIRAAIVWHRVRQPRYTIVDHVPAFVQNDEDLRLMQNAGWL